MRTHPIRSGNTALVTGGASGIGLGIAQAMIEAGLRVIVADVRNDHLQRARDVLAPAAHQAVFLTLDVTQRAHWHAARAHLEESIGELHVLCLNAGVGVLGSMLESTEADWDWITSVNLTGVLTGLETFLPHLRAHGRPAHVVATSSMGGLVVANDGGIYSATKFGVVALIEGLRRDLRGSNLSASVLCPAAVNTHIYDHERMRPAPYRHSGLARDTEALDGMEAFAKQILRLGRDPIEVGRMVRDGIESDQAYIFTDRNVRPTLISRRDALVAFT